LNYPSPHKEVRYVVCRPAGPGEPEGEREEMGRHHELGLAISHARRTGPGTSVHAEGGTFYPSGPGGQHSRWHVEWINHNVYQTKA
jgi:hypothetical protein